MLATPPILDRLAALADGTRSRILLLLDRHELTVSELCTVLQLPQSTVSRHLKILGDDGWIVSRAEGTSRLYRMPAGRLDGPARRLWQLVREQVVSTPGSAHDLQRLESVLARRRTATREFFSTSAGQWDRLRGELFGERSDLLALVGLLDERWVVGDLGCGTGRLAEALAPFVARVIAVDESSPMLAAARRRLSGATAVDLRHGELEALPIENAELDAAIFCLVLHYVAEPVAALREARRTLRPDARLLIVDMLPHDREEFRTQMGHQWLGLSRDQLHDWLAEAGFDRMRHTPLPADPAAKGPTLFACSARAA
ncbi:MAG TPA: metalloregulator ArsR/SmtB family transcription factor [Gemmatimonadaceae bacterium]|nr:metalloregulator ArsR/SmtB family transcription factor [Gemmatimonadaceae bacterium]